MRPALLVSLAVVLGAGPLAAQTEADLRRAFEGTTVTVKLDMPGTDDGVDVYPGQDPAIDFPRHANRLKQFGTALRSGQEIMVTKVKVKKDLIEFQLGGGGFGTFGDDDATTVASPTTAKSRREQDLEKSIKKETDQARKRSMQRELDDLRDDRRREDAQLAASTSEATQEARANVRQRRLEGGSRFNLRWKNGVPGDALTPAGVRVALAQYVGFPGGVARTDATPLQPASAPASGAGIEDASKLRKGLLLADVERALGPAEHAEQRKEGTLAVSSRIYRADGRRVQADFVEGVLVRYSIASD